MPGEQDRPALGESPMERGTSPSPVEEAAGTSPWTPLFRPAFRAIWIATLISNIGGWMQDMGAAWLMTSLTSSPVLIALVQAAASLPMFLLAVPAGALADIVERRRLLLIGNFSAFAAVSALSYFTLLGRTSPGMLLGLTFAVGLGEALEAPAFQAVVTELVPRSELATAVSLNSAGYNLARAVGPALGGLVVARVGAGANFLLNALAFLGVLVVLYRWREAPRRSVLPAERFTGAMRAGLRYVAYAPELRAVLVRTGAFIISGSALWALLPVLVREWRRRPSAYGILLGALGVGAVLGASVLPLLKRRPSLDRLVAFATIVFGAVTLASAFVLNFGLLIAIMLAGGLAWMVLISSFNVAARLVVPSWVQARSLAVYLLVSQGGMALGSLGWGVLAARWGVRRALMCASASLLLSIVLASRYSLTPGAPLNLQPAGKWPVPEISPDPSEDNTPVLVTVEYEIDPNRTEEFVADMQEMEAIRRRDGALQWGLFIDPTGPGRYLEEFLVESWLEHMRQHERFTVSDQQVQQRILELHIGAEPPRVTHYLAEER
jgi:MFS family permease